MIVNKEAAKGRGGKQACGLHSIINKKKTKELNKRDKSNATVMRRKKKLKARQRRFACLYTNGLLFCQQAAREDEKRSCTCVRVFGFVVFVQLLEEGSLHGPVPVWRKSGARRARQA